jgi:hypothetical protein
MVAAGLTAVVFALTSSTPASAAPGEEAAGDEFFDSRGGVSVQQSPFPLADPAVVPNPQTSVALTFSRGTVQVRFGTYQGTQYGWGRALGANANHWVRFEVDLDGDRSWDLANAWRIGTRNYTRGYPTSSSANRAFRACIVRDPAATCNSGSNGTFWW